MIMLFDDPIFLENSQIRLVPLDLDSIDDVMTFAADESIWSFFSHSPKIFSRDGIEHMIRNLLQERNVRYSCPFLIFDKLTGKASGIIKYENIVPRHSRIDIGGLVIAKEFESTTLAEASFTLLANYAFTELDAIRIGAFVDSRNIFVKKFCNNFGLKSEGILRSYAIDKTGYVCDFEVFSMIDQEWAMLKEKLPDEWLN